MRHALVAAHNDSGDDIDQPPGNVENLRDGLSETTQHRSSVQHPIMSSSDSDRNEVSKAWTTNAVVLLRIPHQAFFLSQLGYISKACL